MTNFTDNYTVFVGFVWTTEAVSSTNAMIRRLGKCWDQLHQLLCDGVFGILHYLWLVKADYLHPLIHAAILLPCCWCVPGTSVKFCQVIGLPRKPPEIHLATGASFVLFRYDRDQKLRVV